MSPASSPPRLEPVVMAMIAARDFRDGDVVNLGLGLPLLCADQLPADREVILHSELGLLGFGAVIHDPDEADPYVLMVGNQPVTALAGMAFMSHDESFAMIRGGRLDIAVLGALQVDAAGNLANTHMPGKVAGNLGGAPDLAVCAKRTIVITHHTTSAGAPKIVERCDLPLTAPCCVDRVITDIAVLDIEDGRIVLREHAPGWDADQIQSLTGAPLEIDPALHEITLA